MRLKLYCPEGWKTAGWQRCIVRDEFGMNVSGKIADIMKRSDDSLADVSSVYLACGSPEEMCFFIESGESSSLDSLADALAEVTGLKVEAVDVDD